MTIPYPTKPPTEPITNLAALPPGTYGVQTKYDGVRCKWYQRTPYTASGKRIPNKDVENMLFDVYNRHDIRLNLDGELLLFNTFTNAFAPFNAVQSAIMSKKSLDITTKQSLVYMVYDYDDGSELNSYERRYEILYHDTFRGRLSIDNRFMLAPIQAFDLPRVFTAFETHCKSILEKGDEGAIIRNMSSPYYYGRCPASLNIIFKYVEWLRRESVVVGYTQLEENLDTSCKRKENMVPIEMLGSLQVRDALFGEFEIGSGFTDAQRRDLWRKRDKLDMNLVTYKYKPAHIKAAPCPAIFVGFRDNRDLTTF